ncbi:SmtA SAM-dependent methyltransferases [Candidatus Methylopumilus planktonicus]|uniref:class I SAM-dependent methyltransferase n=1 Tax=Candidatus Methylopumilus planktonicus TaxID=1581557 RepID=UPI003BEEDB63
MSDQFMREYHSRLTKRSLFGFIYRRYYLYPKIWKRCTGKVLDIGCGIGDFLRMTPDSVGADINKYNIEYCKKNNIPAFFFENNTLPFESNVFDTIVFDNVLEHIDDYYPILIESLRVLKKGGFVIVGVPALDHFFYDYDHKTYHSSQSLEDSFYLKNIKCKEIFYTPKNKLLRKKFVHSCRWAVYEKI